MILDESDFTQILLDSLPVGSFWPRSSDSNWGIMFSAIAGEFAAIDALNQALLKEMSPVETTIMFDEWEAELGLPDPCITEPQSIAQRRIAMVERYYSTQRITKQFLIDLAAQLGYTITIDEFSPTNPGPDGQLPIVKPSGEIFHVFPAGEEWNYVWRVNAPATTSVRLQVPFRTGDQLVSQGNELLECTLRQYAQLHLILVFAYD